MRVITLSGETDFVGWRSAARRLIRESVAPENVDWIVAGEQSLFEHAPDGAVEADHVAAFTVPKEFLDLAGSAILHSDRARFALLYRLLWRLRAQAKLLQVASDEDVARVRAMTKSIARDIHKMHAYVRFRQISGADGPMYVAWFEPSHHILAAAAPFFVRRFPNMRWSILTPEACAYWDGKELHCGPGASRAQAPEQDALETLWRSYYASIFNPARLKVSTMQGHMPKKYWHNLPEAVLIPELIAQANRRTQTMIEEPPSSSPRHVIAYPVRELSPIAADSLANVSAEASRCARCPLAQHATQTVFGEGPRDAAVMFVGEQPGDREDLVGKPFVGPAGQLFDRALAAAGLERSSAYVTNAVKHFKFEPRGKRRLHKTAAAKEIDACSVWLDAEIKLVAPKLIVALGATAARALLRRSVSVNDYRGQLLEYADATQLLITVHPSYLLRLPRPEQEHEYRRWTVDLRMAAPFFGESSDVDPSAKMAVTH